MAGGAALSAVTQYRVAVRALCEFTAKTGDLDLRFTPSPTAQEGIAGHAHVTGRRNASYERELSVSGQYKELELKGRIDGYDPDKNRLEEIKTFRGNFALLPDNHRALHWAQAKIYGALLCQARNLEDIELALVYFDIVAQKETVLRERFSRLQLQEFLADQCERFLQWARQELDHRQARDSACERLAFPHSAFRPGQRHLAEAVYKSAHTGRCLLAEAPTGSGKTIGTLFPLLKATARQRLDKIFFLTAKTPGRQLALAALQQLAVHPLRTLELVAREKACEHPDKACHGESCPLARGFYDRLPQARRAAAGESILHQSRLREIALEHQVCPYYLSQEMARWSDVIVGDYNYYFDLSAMLHALTTANQWRVALLVDEAHNLVERGRGMYSAQLNQLQLRRVKKQVPKTLARALSKLNSEWNALNNTVASPANSQLPDSESGGYQLLDQLPQSLLDALQRASAAITDHLTEEPFALASDLTQFHFDVMHFLKIAELYSAATFMADITLAAARSRPHSTINLRNLIPAALLQRRSASAHTTTFFSATLRPAHYYRDMLGLAAGAAEIEVSSPFAAEQLQVRIARHVSTRYSDRSQSLLPITSLITEQYQQRPGNYLAFFSSYQYLEQVLSRLQEISPDIPVWRQSRNMTESERQAFLDRFESTGQGVGFAVLGGAFGEGVDLPGTRLIGAFIATLGLPQTNAVNEQLKRRLEQNFGDGHSYTYLYPGLQKVVQAAGRVIRTENDTGIVHLVDDRFAQTRVRRLLPSWWKVE